ncbi:hypothetical protein [Thermomonas brevis]
MSATQDFLRITAEESVKRDAVILTLHNDSARDIPIGPLSISNSIGDIKIEWDGGGGKGVLIQPGAKSLIRWSRQRIIYPGEFIGKVIPMNSIGIPRKGCSLISFDYNYSNGAVIVRSRNSVKLRVCFP